MSSITPKTLISAKDIADAPYTCRATQLVRCMGLSIAGEPVFPDIEFQSYCREGDRHPDGRVRWRKRIGRIAIINSVGDVVMDVYAAYPKEADMEKRMDPGRFGVVKTNPLFNYGAVDG